MRLTLKILIIIGMTLVILIPLSMVRDVISDREFFRHQAMSDVARSYAGRQVFAGPVLIVPYTEVEKLETHDNDGGSESKSGSKKKTVKVRVSRNWIFFPENLDISGPMRPDTRKRGLHKINVYEWQGQAQAQFKADIPAADPALEREIGQPILSMGIADVHGLRGVPKLRVNGEEVALAQGFSGRGEWGGESSGLHARLPAPRSGQTLSVEAQVELPLGGMETLELVPLGGINRFTLASSWLHPSFSGRSPHHTLDANGFKADWEIASVASGAQQQFLDGGMRSSFAGADGYGGDKVGVSLIDPVNVYSQSDRATKYGVLFVALTFIGFFLFELMKQLRIHPIQYALVGFGLAIFFLLLVSLSEHIDFIWAYLAASVACIGLLGFYLSAVLKSLARGLGFAALLSLLYAVLYGLLISEDNALVLGAGLLFAVLAIIMAVTRKLDWYEFADAQAGLRMTRRRETTAAAGVSLSQGVDGGHREVFPRAPHP
jgi:inner membrane protein